MNNLQFTAAVASAILFYIGISQYAQDQIMSAIFWAICSCAFALLFIGLRVRNE